MKATIWFAPVICSFFLLNLDVSLKYDIYLDTSVINFLFADDAAEKKTITMDLFDNFIKKETYNTFISNFVIEEINNTEDNEKRDKSCMF
jgi:rRNA-processing protein FCF1